MQLTARVTVREQGPSGVWLVTASPESLTVLGAPKARHPGRTIIAVEEGIVSKGAAELSFGLSGAEVLTLGDSDECVVVLRGTTAPPSELTKPSRSSKNIASTGYRLGDDDFIGACRSEGLPEAAVRLAEELLLAIREFADDDLKEGLHRKWVTYPRNFLAITIQNTKKQFCIQVKKSPILQTLTDRLDIRPDRPGYARFWLKEPSQLTAAVAAVRESAQC